MDTIDFDTHRLPDGRTIRILSDRSFELTDLAGKRVQYGHIEHITYKPCLLEEWRAMTQPLRLKICE